MNITVTNYRQKNIKNLINFGIEALKNNRFDHAINFFKKAAIRGEKWGKVYHKLLHREEDKVLARDIILCAENKT